MPGLNYFEVAFSNGSANDNNAQWICIRGTQKPTLAEAHQFLALDCERFGLPVVGVYPIDKDTARNFYDFSNENNWPIFSKEDGDER